MKRVKRMKFSKKQVASSSLFSDDLDIIQVVLRDEELYTIDEVKKLIMSYMKGEVK